jgi:hypothetical protein
MKITATLEQEMKVEFTEPEKAKAFFIDGDWKNSFYTFKNLEDLAESLMLNTKDKLLFREHWHEDKEIKSGAKVEGFPVFYSQVGGKLATEENSIIGQIIISGDHSPEVSYLGEI